MSPMVKILIGLIAALLIGWIWHGPLGHGAALIDRMEGQARTAVAATEVPGIEVHLARHPLKRIATLDGPANDLQREGLGSQKGISDYVRAIDGIAKVRWADEKPATAMPLLAEGLLLHVIAYLLGLGLAAIFWGRKKKEGFL
ncbi:hypothetical protein [Sphingosinicella rhizophila]|uniref:Peptidase n=1 Tax=Sphingosinicella rhizophila TaxID=3050082 RepID=A0ABU3QCT1_9SPHN|nr:hypothetical protein [Sphingosinicella sp. GR2756]MDT9600949.1 hypothetical protein [Sphingosinicella sp. GR2756]